MAAPELIRCRHCILQHACRARITATEVWHKNPVYICKYAHPINFADDLCRC